MVKWNQCAGLEAGLKPKMELQVYTTLRSLMLWVMSTKWISELALLFHSRDTCSGTRWLMISSIRIHGYHMFIGWISSPMNTMRWERCTLLTIFGPLVMHMFYSLSLFCPSQDAKLYCRGNYVDVNENNTECVTIMNTIMDVSVLPSSIRIVVYLFGCKKSERFVFCVDILQCLLQINLCQILEPQCAFSSKKPENLEWDRRVQEAETMRHLMSDETPLPPLKCRVSSSS